MTVVVVVLLVAVVTVGSRMASLALLPAPTGPVAALVARLPVPLFAALAALSLTGAAAGPRDPALLTALGCAAVAARWRSLLLVLGAGLGGYLLVSLLR